jgi:hypothetical protein
LVALQLKVPEVRFINLTAAEASKLMTTRPSFDEALTIARAYDINRLSEWIAPVYQQTVVGGNFVYLQELLQNIPYDPTLYQELVKKFKADPQRSGHTASMKKLLGTIEDRFLRYDMARELGFNDIFQQLNTSAPEVASWKSERTQTL